MVGFHLPVLKSFLRLEGHDAGKMSFGVNEAGRMFVFSMKQLIWRMPT